MSADNERTKAADIPAYVTLAMEIETTTTTTEAWDDCPAMSAGRTLAVGLAATVAASIGVLAMTLGFLLAFGEAMGGGSVLPGFAFIPVAWVGGIFGVNYAVRAALGEERLNLLTSARVVELSCWYIPFPLVILLGLTWLSGLDQQLGPNHATAVLLALVYTGLWSARLHSAYQVRLKRALKVPRAPQDRE